MALAKWALTFLLDYLFRKLWPRAVAWGFDLWDKYVTKPRRAKEQEKAQEKVETDVQNGAERTDETRKNEQDWLNS